MLLPYVISRWYVSHSDFTIAGSEEIVDSFDGERRAKIQIKSLLFLENWIIKAGQGRSRSYLFSLTHQVSDGHN